MTLRDRIERLLEPVGRKLNFRFYFVRFQPYYWPIPDRRSLTDDLFTRRSQLPGVRLNEVGQLRLLEEFRARYATEYETIDRGFGEVDAQVLYCMLRHHKPARVIEIGSGQSTRLTAKALLKNASEQPGRPAPVFTAVEPYPAADIRAGFPGLTRLLEQRAQDVPLATFEQLEADDVLFIDSSHVLAIGTDVQYEFLEIIPRLKPGVLVHVHDIFLPAEYPKKWVVDGRFWDEQYLLQAFLAFNDSFEVLWAGQWMHLAHPDQLKAAFTTYDPARAAPGSFWMRRVK
jgi:predicted O-methyltransferase YrrM